MGDDTIVHADYARHVDEIYLDVSAKLIQHVDPALALSVAGDMGKRRPRNLQCDHPSWVVRWELSLETSSLGRPGHWYTTGGSSTNPDIRIDVSNRALTIPAILLDEVTWFCYCHISCSVRMDSDELQEIIIV
ncbi:HET-domain-containing protein [Venturia nashicola]|nr:HET-domain-containing protein [Venturia nashicola]